MGEVKRQGGEIKIILWLRQTKMAEWCVASR